MEQKQVNKEDAARTTIAPLEKIAQRMAAFLALQSERLTHGEKRIILIVFGVLAATASMTLVISPVFMPATSRPAWRTEPLDPQKIVEQQTSNLRRNRSSDYSPALRALDSLYASDPTRFLQIIEHRLATLDSLKKKR